eukprot:6843138-Pyramimonas_sp.AAC.1
MKVASEGPRHRLVGLYPAAAALPLMPRRRQPSRRAQEARGRSPLKATRLFLRACVGCQLWRSATSSAAGSTS